MIRLLAIGIAFAVLMLAARESLAASLTLLDGLPDPSLGIFERAALGVSGDGSVVVGTFGGQAFRWTAATGMVGLDTLPTPVGGASSTARAINADGSVIVGGTSSAIGDQPFRHTIAGGMLGLGFPGDGAFAVSADGSVLAGTHRGMSDLPEAFRWTAAGGAVPLGFIDPNDSVRSDAFAISGDGNVVVGGGETFSTGDVEAFRWTAAGGLVPLGDLPGGIVRSSARGASFDGSVIVGRGRSASGTEAFRWTAATGMVPLGDLPGGGFTSSANAVTPDGTVLVGSGATAAGVEAMRWTAATGMQRVADLLLAAGIDPAAPANGGWTKLEQAFAVSADGNTIAGVGIRNGNDEAFVAVLGAACACPGDVNDDNSLNGADIQGFVGCAIAANPNGTNCGCGDFDNDDNTDFNDVAGFVNELMSNTGACL